MIRIILIFIFLIVSFVPAYSQQDTLMLNEVEIVNFSIDHPAFELNKITPITIEQSPVMDVGDILRSVPNVSGIKKGVAGIDPVIRGFKYAQLNVMIDGSVKIEGGCPNRMDPTAAHVDVNDLLEIKIIKGPYALKYGPSFGGFINLVTWRPRFYKRWQFHGNGFIGLQSNGMGYKSKIEFFGGSKNFTYQVSAGTRKYEDYKDGSGRWVKASMNSYFAKANFGFRINKKHIIDAGIDGSLGRNIDFPALSMDEREDNTLIYKFNYHGNNISKNINAIRFNSWVSDVDHTMDNKNRPFSDTVVAVSFIHSMDAGARGSINLKMGNGVLESGFDLEYIYKNGNRVKSMIRQPELPVKDEIIWNNSFYNNVGLYGEYRLLHKQFDWVVSVRLDFNSAGSDPMLRIKTNNNPVYENSNTGSSFINISINGGFTWNLNTDNVLSLSLGRGVRSPDLTERFITLLPVGYDRYDYIGNPQLKPEANYEMDLNFEHTSKLTCSLKPSLFLSYVTNYIGSERVPPSVVRPQTKGVLGVKQFVNFDYVWLTGMKISWSSPKNRLWLVNLNVSYTYGVNPNAVGYNIENGHVTGEYPIKNDALPEIPPLELNGNFRYSLLNNQLVPVIHYRVVLPQNHISVSYGEQSSKFFQTMDIKLKYSFNSYFTIWGGINNLFNCTYYEHLNRNIIGSTLPLYEPGRNFFVNFVFKL